MRLRVSPAIEVIVPPVRSRNGPHRILTAASWPSIFAPPSSSIVLRGGAPGTRSSRRARRAKSWRRPARARDGCIQRDGGSAMRWETVRSWRGSAQCWRPTRLQRNQGRRDHREHGLGPAGRSGRAMQHAGRVARLRRGRVSRSGSASTCGCACPDADFLTTTSEPSRAPPINDEALAGRRRWSHAAVWPRWPSPSRFTARCCGLTASSASAGTLEHPAWARFATHDARADGPGHQAV